MSVVLSRHSTFLNYIELLKPRETVLLTFIGACTAIIASGGHLQVQAFALTIITLLLGSAGCNGLTNYLDREVDAKMTRTQNRVLPLKLIDPPQKVLPLIISFILLALFLAWVLNPLCFIFGVVGVIASSIWRKTISCTVLGIVAGCSSVLIGWFAFNSSFENRILFICLLVALWIPIHVWSVMISKREDYINAGLSYFPLNINTNITARVLFILSIMLYGISFLLYFVSDFHLLYLIVANILGITMISSAALMLFRTNAKSSWRLYKLSSFPYLGIIFLVMCLDVLIM